MAVNPKMFSSMVNITYVFRFKYKILDFITHGCPENDRDLGRYCLFLTIFVVDRD